MTKSRGINRKKVTPEENDFRNRLIRRLDGIIPNKDIAEILGTYGTIVSRAIGKPKGTVLERFWDNITTEPNSGCWLWLGEPDGNWGYGRFSVDGHGGRMQAHRWSYQHHKGEIPDGMKVCHRCDIPLCVNPDHLFLGSQLDNMRDRLAKDRYGRGELSPVSKLTDESVSEIRVALKNGASLNGLSEKYNVSKKTIFNIKHDKIWKHVK